MTTLQVPLAERDSSDAIAHRRRSLSGWGGKPRSICDVVSPRSIDDLQRVEVGSAGIIPRGLGRSYGDAGQLAGGTVIDMTGLTGVAVDAAAGVVTALAGTSLGQILDVAVPLGWFLPVTPGTTHVTVGGAIAANVHGKNHHRDGSWGGYVESMELLTPRGETMTVIPRSDAFSATVGGMGLTGTILQATIRLLPIETAWMSVDTFRCNDLGAVMSALVEADSRHRYSVAWLDLTGASTGRGVVMGADHRPSDQTPIPPPTWIRHEPPVAVPGWMPGVVNDLTVSLFNRLWFRRAPRQEFGKPVGVGSFFYPLDAAAGWNHLYGRAGFLQYQFVVPPGEEGTLFTVAEELANAPTPVSLAVLKRMGPSKGGLLSFPMHGWTLALDMPLGDIELAGLLDRCDARIAGVGGRVYLAKDARLRPEVFRDMYPDLPRWQQIQGRLDPDRVLRSDLSRRLRLTT